jgi:hypothetical protein
MLHKNQTTSYMLMLERKFKQYYKRRNNNIYFIMIRTSECLMAEVQFKVSLCGIYGGKIGTGTEFSRSTFCFS